MRLVEKAMASVTPHSIFEKPVVRSGCTGITGGVDFQILLDLKMPFEPETKNIWETGGVLEPGLS